MADELSTEERAEVAAVLDSVNQVAAERTAMRVTRVLHVLGEYGDADLQRESIEYLTAQCRVHLQRRA